MEAMKQEKKAPGCLEQVIIWNNNNDQYIIFIEAFRTVSYPRDVAKNVVSVI